MPKYILALLLLSGCATGPTLEELKQEAFQTGDWSEVEKREEMIKRREARRGPSCPGDQVAWCESWGGIKRCSCVSRASVREALGRW